MHYRRADTPGATYFYTVNLAERKRDLLVRHIDMLRQAVRQTRQTHPFGIGAMVVLPDHLHAVRVLPPGDASYPLRWSLIKAAFSRQLPKEESMSDSRLRKRGIWKRRCWEHQFRDDADLQAHVDYIHFNPVKHGHAQRPADWPFSTIHRYIRLGLITSDWAGGNGGEGCFGE